jgi:hypothetical protein
MCFSHGHYCGRTKRQAIAIVVQYMEAIDALLNLQNHVVAGPVPSVATKFKCDKERRLGKFGFFVFPLTAAAAVVSIQYFPCLDLLIPSAF